MKFHTNHTDKDVIYVRKPKGKHIFGTVTVGSKGQIVIPKKARDVFGIQPGDTLMLVGDEKQGLAIITNRDVSRIFTQIMGGNNDGSDPHDGTDEEIR